MEKHLLSGTKLQNGKYVIIRKLGQGGFGITYQAEQPSLHKKVAIKECFFEHECERKKASVLKGILSKSTKKGSVVVAKTDAEGFAKYQERFMKEAQTTANFLHPNIVNVTDVFKENGTVYYVMDFIEGQSLSDIVKENGPITENLALHYIRKIASALKYIHKRHVNHLDIKPANIMVRKEDNEPILIDFGVSKHYDEHLYQTTNTPVGLTHGYAPLEQTMAGGVSSFSPQTDIYALGATLYAMLTGKTPSPANILATQGLPEMPDSISHSTRMAIAKCMQTNKANRPANVNEFLQFLDSHADDGHNMEQKVDGDTTNPKTDPEKNDNKTPAPDENDTTISAENEAERTITTQENKPRLREIQDTTDNHNEEVEIIAPAYDTENNKSKIIIWTVLSIAALAIAGAVFFMMSNPDPVTPDPPTKSEEVAATIDSTAHESQNDQTINSPNDQTTNSPNDQTTNSPNNQTTPTLRLEAAGGVDQTTSLLNKQTTSLPNDQTTSHQNHQTTNPPNNQTTKQPTPLTTGTLDLGYAVWNGDIKNGKPHGKGTMTFKSSHLIDSKDINQNTAGPGDIITGKYNHGNLIYGTWTKTNGETTKLMIGQ